MPPKRKFTEADMDKLDILFNENQRQSKVLDEILLCIKGSSAMNIEGIIPAQKRLQKEMTQMEETIKQIDDWKNAVTIYIGILTSKKIWKFLLLVVAIIAIGFLSVKYGFQTVWQYVKSLFI
jgi:hypothetical protein